MSRDTVLLIAIALGRLLVHVLTNGHYGFHRDELATLDDARYLAWGYVAYPPLTPFLARVAWSCPGCQSWACASSVLWHNAQRWCSPA